LRAARAASAIMSPARHLRRVCLRVLRARHRRSPHRQRSYARAVAHTRALAAIQEKAYAARLSYFFQPTTKVREGLKDMAAGGIPMRGETASPASRCGGGERWSGGGGEGSVWAGGWGLGKVRRGGVGVWCECGGRAACIGWHRPGRGRCGMWHGAGECRGRGMCRRAQCGTWVRCGMASSPPHPQRRRKEGCGGMCMEGWPSVLHL